MTRETKATILAIVAVGFAFVRQVWPVVVRQAKDVWAMRKNVLVRGSRPVVVGIVIAATGGGALEGSRPRDETAQVTPGYEYRVLATAKTSTMEKELNAGAEAGFRFQAVMGGETPGGSEVVVVMVRSADVKARVAYRLLATSKTSTMEKELQDAAEAGFDYRGRSAMSSGSHAGWAAAISSFLLLPFMVLEFVNGGTLSEPRA